MVFEHDYEKYPELTNKQIAEIGFTSPFPQITEDFEAEVSKVVDGDTVHLRWSMRDFDFPLRLLDINAPELSEGGQEAKEWLKNRIEGEMVTIQINKFNRVGKYGRLLGKIIHSGLDVGSEMLSLGLVKLFGEKDYFPLLAKELRIKKWFSN